MRIKSFLPLILFGLIFATEILVFYHQREVIAGVDLSTSLENFSERLGQADSSIYLRVAINFSKGLGVVDYCKECKPPHYIPFYFWGPGTPEYFGSWLALTRGETVKSLFVLFWLSYFIAAGIFLFIAYKLHSDLVPRLIAAVCIAFCPPLFAFLKGAGLASSELACIAPLALMIFCLVMAFEKIKIAGDKKLVYFWFGLLGLSIGFLSLIRESHLPFANFIFVFLIISAVLKRYSFKKAFLSGVLVVAFAQLTILPVKIWNQDRLGQFYVSSSSVGNIWRYGIWSKHDAVDWYFTSGIGVGEYLDPQAAEAVEKYYQTGNTDSLFSIKKFAKAILNRPIDFVLYKLKRLPVLFLGTREYPNLELTSLVVWNTGFYTFFIAYLLLSWKKKSPIPEFIYLYFLFISCAAFIIHFEYRYTEGIWLSFFLLPSLLYQQIIGKNVHRKSQLTKKSI